MKKLFLALFFTLFTATSLSADNVQITAEIPFVEIEIGDHVIFIERIQDEENQITGTFAKTSRACPPFCIRPMQIAGGVTTVGELEVIAFLEIDVAAGTGILIDSRTPGFYAQGTIPGAVNIPFTVLDPAENEYLGAIIEALGGVRNSQGEWDFTQASDLLLFCNGLWCGQSPRAINNLLSVGYPADRLFYYRGGMESWLSVGLTVMVPGDR